MRISLLIVLALAVGCVARKSLFSEDGSPTWAAYETIPEDVNLETEYSTYDVWMELIENAQTSIRVGAFYMDFANGTQYLGHEGQKGVDVLDALIAAGRRGVKIELALNQFTGAVPYSPDPHILSKMGLAEVRWINWSLVSKYGIVHTKMMMTDYENLSIGSANIAWDSMTQVKELGIAMTKVPILTEDANKIWEMYWYLGAENTTSCPNEWPKEYDTFFNSVTPLNLDIQGDVMDTFISVDPVQLATPNRDIDLTAITTLIDEAKSYVNLEVMDMGATTVYLPHNVYDAAVDTAFRSAPFNTQGLQVRMLIGVWNHTLCSQYEYMQSLAVLDNITVRLFRVPDLPDLDPQIPFTRVAHSKYIVTDNGAWVSTQNLYADYWLDTGGMSLNFRNAPAVVDTLTDKFLRDWDSEYAEPICIGTTCDWGTCSDRPINS